MGNGVRIRNGSAVEKLLLGIIKGYVFKSALKVHNNGALSLLVSLAAVYKKKGGGFSVFVGFPFKGNAGGQLNAVRQNIFAGRYKHRPALFRNLSHRIDKGKGAVCLSVSRRTEIGNVHIGNHRPPVPVFGSQKLRRAILGKGIFARFKGGCGGIFGLLFNGGQGTFHRFTAFKSSSLRA